MPVNVRHAVLAVLLVASPSRADELDECIAAHKDTQQLRLDGKLKAAREQTLVCGRPVCPAPLRAECGAWLSELEREIPTVVLAARGEDGADIVDVRVLVDGEELTRTLDGKAVLVDPGPHVFRFERADSPPIERRLVLRQGDKLRRVVVDFAPDAKATPAPPAVPPERDQPALERPIPLGVWLLAGVAVAGGAAFTYFGLNARSRENELRREGCSPNCSKAETDAIERNYIIADAALGVGVVALGAAGVLFFTRPARPAQQDAVVPLFAPSRRGAVVGASVSF